MRKTVAVTRYVVVEIDETKFDENFMSEFRDGFYGFETLEDHIKHLAQMTARGVIPETKYWKNEFIEGYGPAEDMGIETSINDRENEIDICDE